MPRESLPIMPRPKICLCAALTFDGRLAALPPLTGQLQARWWARLRAWSRAVILTDTADAIAGLARAAQRVVVIEASARETALEELLSQPATRQVLCCGSPELARGLITGRRLDELSFLVRPAIGGAGAATLTGPAGDFFLQSISYRLARLEVVVGECLLQYRFVDLNA